MRKILTIALLLGMTAGLCACQSEVDVTTTWGTLPTTTETSEIVTDTTEKMTYPSATVPSATSSHQDDATQTTYPPATVPSASTSGRTETTTTQTTTTQTTRETTATTTETTTPWWTLPTQTTYTPPTETTAVQTEETTTKIDPNEIEPASDGFRYVYDEKGNAKIVGAAFDESYVDLVIPDTTPDGVPVTAIGERAFLDKQFKTITIGKNVEIIEESAFFGNTILKSLVIPGNVHTIGKNAFAVCKQLLSLTIEEGVRTLEDGAFHDAMILRMVRLPSTLTSIGEEVFSMTQVQDIYYNSTKARWDAISKAENWDEWMGAYKFELSITHPWEYPMSEYPLFEKEGYYEVHCLDEDIIVREQMIQAFPSEELPVTSTEGMVFISNGGGTCTFAGWDGRLVDYSTVVVPSVSPDGEKVIAIGEGAFNGLEFLQEVVIPEGVIRIEDGAFSGCRALTKISIPSSVKEIGEDVFNRVSLAAFAKYKNAFYVGNAENPFHAVIKTADYRQPFAYIHRDSKVICAKAFRNTQIEEIDMSDDICTIGANAFEGAKFLLEIKIGKNVEKIGKQAFKDCESLRNLTIVGNVSVIDEVAFVKCTNLETVIIEEGVRSVGIGMFMRCKIQHIMIPKSLTSLPERFLDTAVPKVTYNGTKAEWDALYKSETWDGMKAAEYIVHCSDGNFSVKKEAVTQ